MLFYSFKSLLPSLFPFQFIDFSVSFAIFFIFRNLHWNLKSYNLFDGFPSDHLIKSRKVYLRLFSSAAYFNKIIIKFSQPNENYYQWLTGLGLNGGMPSYCLSSTWPKTSKKTIEHARWSKRGHDPEEHWKNYQQGSGW